MEQRRKVVLYHSRSEKGQSFKNAPKVVVPSQSMSLKEIIQRFVRRESLPVEKAGVYEDRMGDLEKLANEDITVRMERASELADLQAKAKKRMQAKADKEKADAIRAEVERQEAEKRSKGSPAPPAPDVNDQPK